MQKRPLRIQTRRLCLRSFSPDDCAALLDILYHPLVGQTYMVPDLATPEEKQRLFDKLRDMSLSESYFVYGIFWEDRLIGMINQADQADNQMELGFAIDPQYHNQGFATEALEACIQALFSMGYARVTTGAFPGNAASIRVMEKCHMERLPQTEEVTYRGKTQHCVLFQKTAP